MRKLFLFAVITASFVMTPVLAMDLEKPIRNIDGKEITGQDGKAFELTMATAVVNSLLSEQTTSEEEKGKNYRLAVQVSANPKDFKPSADDVVRIRKALGATQPTLIYGQIMAVLDSTFSDKK